MTVTTVTISTVMKAATVVTKTTVTPSPGRSPCDQRRVKTVDALQRGFLGRGVQALFPSARRNFTARAMSSASPVRRSGVRETKRWWASSSVSFSGHKIAPGATALTRTAGPSSCASDLVSDHKPALVAQ